MAAPSLVNLLRQAAARLDTSGILWCVFAGAAARGINPYHYNEYTPDGSVSRVVCCSRVEREMWMSQWYDRNT